MSSTTSDGALHAYLEDVSPEGRVTHVDEGIFRVINRKEVDPNSLPYTPSAQPTASCEKMRSR
jgi:predicted acyl esterase